MDFNFNAVTSSTTSNSVLIDIEELIVITENKEKRNQLRDLSNKFVYCLENQLASIKSRLKDLTMGLCPICMDKFNIDISKIISGEIKLNTHFYNALYQMSKCSTSSCFKEDFIVPLKQSLHLYQILIKFFPESPDRKTTAGEMFYQRIKELWDKYPNKIRINSSNNTILYKTDAIELEGECFGQFEIELNVKSVSNIGSNIHVQLIALDGNYKNDYFHPHINVHGALCLGESMPMINAALSQLDFEAYFEIVEATLNTYNPDNPYLEIEAWIGYTCKDCSCNDKIMNCCENEFCRESICNDCSLSCANCGILCSECYGEKQTCNNCNESYCHECTEDSGFLCHGCNEYICKECMDDEDYGYCEQCCENFCSTCSDSIYSCDQCRQSICDKCESIDYCDKCEINYCSNCECNCEEEDEDSDEE